MNFTEVMDQVSRSFCSQRRNPSCWLLGTLQIQGISALASQTVAASFTTMNLEEQPVNCLVGVYEHPLLLQANLFYLKKRKIFTKSFFFFFNLTIIYLFIMQGSLTGPF